MNRTLSSIVILTLAVIIGCACGPDKCERADAAFPELTGPYFGQTPPGETPEIFAPGLISTGLATRDVAMTPDGKEIYFGVFLGGRALIMETHVVDGRWTEPRVAPFSGTALNIEPSISPDGSRFFFLSTRPQEGQEEKPGWAYQDIWVMDRTENGWSEPSNLGPPINSEDAEFFPSVTRDGTLYFTRGQGHESAIYRSRLSDGAYQEPERLPDQVNCGTSQYNAFIAPDESYIIVCAAGREDSVGGSDYYVVFRNPDDSWSEPINMGNRINSPTGRGWSPYVSPDGKYFFFMSSRVSSMIPADLSGISLTKLLEYNNQPENGASDIYWVDASFIKDLRP